MNETLCSTIRKAFAEVKLGDGVGLQQAQGLDDYEDTATCARFRANDQKDDWSRIPVEELNRCNSSLSFFDADGMRFHLRAFLIADLHGLYHFGMAFSLTNLSDYSISQFALLTLQQRMAVRGFLLHLAEAENYEFHRPEILRALNDYWTTTP